ncbi:MAG: hypothetical protein DRJ15_13175 [Bacteroidetes bacterium]|nr:MAG: hypothetical protein DRJ15_13175 [Bacteroidota bacterium]
MRKRRYTYRVRYYTTVIDLRGKESKKLKYHNITTTDVDQVLLHMKAHDPDADVQVIHKLVQVWGKG